MFANMAHSESGAQCCLLLLLAMAGYALTRFETSHG